MNIDFQKRLLERQSELLTHLEQLKLTAKPVDLNQPIGRLSRMDAIQQQQMALSNKNQVEVSLKLVEQALSRLKNDEYGICLQCEEEISKKRLLARPETPFCIRCAK